MDDDTSVNLNFGSQEQSKKNNCISLNIILDPPSKEHKKGGENEEGGDRLLQDRTLRTIMKRLSAIRYAIRCGTNDVHCEEPHKCGAGSSARREVFIYCLLFGSNDLNKGIFW